MFDHYSNRQLRLVIRRQFDIILNMAARINTLDSRLDSIIADAEAAANERLTELVQRQVDHDNRILDGWHRVNEELWQEFEAYKAAQAVEPKAKSKRLAKEAKRWQRVGEL